VRELEPFLRDPDPEVRARAALAAARLGGPEAAGWLRLAARDPESAVRAAAALGMGLTDDAGLAGDALVLGRGPAASSAERAAAASAALRLGLDRLLVGEAAFAALLDDAEPSVRRAAFRSLVGASRGLKEKRPACPPRLLVALGPSGDPDPVVRASAALAIRGIVDPDKAPREPVADALRAALADPDVDARAAAALALGAFGEGTGDLAPLLRGDPAPRVRVGAARGLARRKVGAAAALLGEAILADPDFGVRAAAAEALAARKEEARPSAEALARGATADPSVLVRMNCLAALHACGGDAARAAAAAASRAEDPFVRAAAAGEALPAEDLARLAGDPEIRVRTEAAGKRKEEGLAICRALLRDPDPVVAATAASALGEIGGEADGAALAEVLAAHPAPAEAPDAWADLRAAAVEALAKRRHPGAAAAARAALADPDPSVREMAANALGTLEGKRPDLPIPRRLLPFVEPGALLVSGTTRVLFETTRGSFTVETDPAAAPVHAARFVERVRAGGYDGTLVHRVVPNFVVQGGDPRGDGSGNGGAPTRQEFSGATYDRGTLGVPRSSPPDSGVCQLFFCHGATPHLDQRYTVMGRIVEGVEVLDVLDVGDVFTRVRVIE
jgi:cyclophilin family peptidyl-prolyl cis-trans isomerase